MPRKTVEIINFNPVPIARPINVPKAGFNDFLKFVFSINSPVNAPKNAPKIRPNGPPIKRPTNKPIVAPINPFLEPPSFFNPIIGIKISNKKTVKEIAEMSSKNLNANAFHELDYARTIDDICKSCPELKYHKQHVQNPWKNSD